MNACQQGFIDRVFQYGITNEKVIPQMMKEAALYKWAATAMNVSMLSNGQLTAEQVQQIFSSRPDIPWETMSDQEAFDIIIQSLQQGQ